MNTIKNSYNKNFDRDLKIIKDLYIFKTKRIK